MTEIQRGDRVTFNGQVCVVEGVRNGRWFSGAPRREARITAETVIPGTARIVGAWVPTLVLEPAPPKSKADREMVKRAADLLRKKVA